MKIYIVLYGLEPIGYYSSYSLAEEALCSWYPTLAESAWNYLVVETKENQQTRKLFSDLFVNKTFTSLTEVNKTQKMLWGFYREDTIGPPKECSIIEHELNENISYNPYKAIENK
jgi:hypothetical protein